MVRAYIKPDPKSPLYGRANFNYRIEAEGAGWKVVAFVRHFNKKSAERFFRRSNKRFRHEVRAFGLDPYEYPIKIERIKR